jgi:hypothetical protein
MHFDPAPLRAGFDWTFRPETYFFPASSSRPEPLPDEVRDAIGRIHPLLMGGLYLPGFLPGEVEIARVQLESVMADVLSVRARPQGKRIAYRVVDEYETVYPVAPATSARPLTLAALARLMEGANPDPSVDGGLALVQVKCNVVYGGCDPRELHGFATVTSRFYPELGAWYERLIDAWLDSQVAERHDDEEAGGGTHDYAR